MDMARLETALRNADAAGDEEAARMLAAEIVKLRRQPATPAAPEYNPTEGMSGLDKFLAGAGKGFVDIGRGVGQRVGMVSEADVARSRALDAPLMETGAGLAGNIVGNVAAFAPTAMVPGANTLTGSAALGALSGLAAPTVEGESVLGNAALGAGGGMAAQGIANTISRVVRPVRSQLAPTTDALANAAETAGIRLNAAQRTGSKPLATLDSVLDYLPFTGDRQAALKGAQRQAWQKTLLAEAGENADAATPEVMGRMKDRISGEFRRLSQSYQMPVDNDLLNALAAVETKYGRRLPTNQRAIVQSYIDDLTSAQALPGDVYQSTRSMLQRQADGLMRSDPVTAGALKEIRDAADEAMGRAVTATGNPDDAAAWTAARKQWKVMRTIEGAVNDADGTISPKRFYNDWKRRNKDSLIYGKGAQDVSNVARIGDEFIADNVPNSGTAQRQFWQNLLTGGGGAMGIGMLTGAVPPAALLGAAAGAATPLAAQGLLWSRPGMRYLSTGLLNDTAATRALANYGRAGLLSGGLSLPLINAAQQ